jgi:amino acid adenylation domain-containing protein
MAEPTGAPALLDDLHDSAPLRDFSRPGDPTAVPASLPLAIGDRAVHAIAAFVVLLACHTRRSRIAIALRAADEPATLRGLVLVASSDRAFADLVAELAGAVQTPSAWPTCPLEPGQHLAGVVVDLAVDGPVFTADLTLRAATAELRFDTRVYRPQSLAPLARQLVALLAATELDDQRALGELPLLDDAERQRVLRDFNSQRLPLPAQTLAELIEVQVARRPDAVCALHGEESLSYAELDAAARRLAWQLVDLGIGPGRYVAVVEERGLAFVVAMLAIWKAGGAYIPVDPRYPEQRVRHMLTDSAVTVAIAGPRTQTLLAPAFAACPALQHRLDPWAAPAAPAGVLPGQRARPADPAYMVYTSGSTGRPKGAIVRHDGAVNHLYAQAQALGTASIARFLQSAPASSDISVWQFAAPLVFGGVTVVVDDATEIETLFDAVQRHGLHLIELVPAVLKFLTEFAATLPAERRALPSLHWVMVTGESAPVAVVNAWLALYPSIPIVNAYGPTEAADDVCQAVIRSPLPARQLNVPIGRPLANLDLYVLDEHLRPLPVGAPGEICIAGIGVGNGYWQQPEKTRLAFVPNPYADAVGPVMYRTGDLGRWRDDGELECLGRLDHQVQLRGMRIELQEIESVLREHPGVQDTVVQAFHDGGGDGQLVAFVVAPGVDDTSLHGHLALRLPRHMVPATWVHLPRLPLNPAGKVDRQALQPPPVRRIETQQRPPYRAPRSAAERALAAVWADELGVPAVGLDDDFFALGGDSMAALAIVVGARQAGWRLRSADVLRHPVLLDLAAAARPVIAAADRQLVPVLPALRPLDASEQRSFLDAHPDFESVAPLTPPQQAIFVHWLLARDKTTYVDQYSHRLDGPLAVQQLEDSWNAVVRRHAALRTAFLRSALSQPAQAVRRELRLKLERVDHGHLDADAQAAALRVLQRDAVEHGFELGTPPLMRLQLVRQGETRHTLVWTHHHIVVDGWAMSQVLAEVMAFYGAALDGRTPVLAAVAPYARYGDWLARLDVASDEGFWRGQFAGVGPAPAMAIPAPRSESAGHGQIDLVLPATTQAALQRQAREASLTLGTLLQAAWATQLAALTGRSDVVFGIVSSGRQIELPEVERMVGLFVTTLPLRVDTSPPTKAWLAALQQRAAAIREHESVPLAQVLRWAGLPPGQPLFETLLVMSNYPAPAATSGPVRVSAGEWRTVPDYALALIVAPGPQLALRLVYERRRFAAEGVAAVARQLAWRLEALARGDDPSGPAPC